MVFELKVEDDRSSLGKYVDMDHISKHHKTKFSTNLRS